MTWSLHVSCVKKSGETESTATELDQKYTVQDSPNNNGRFTATPVQDSSRYNGRLIAMPVRRGFAAMKEQRLAFVTIPFQHFDLEMTGKPTD